MDVLVGTGEIVTCSREENVELFRAFPNSYGSLGYAVRLNIELEEVADFIELAHVRYSDLADFQDGLAQAAAARTWDGRLIHGPVAVAFRAQLPFLGNAFAALREASPAPVAAAVLCATLSILAMAVVMRILLTSDGVRVNMGNASAITLASNAWSTTVPGGPAISAWLTFKVHRSWGASVGLCGWFFVISGAMSTVWLLVIGIAAVIFLGAHLSVLALAGSLIVALAAITGLFWAIYNPHILRRWVRYLPQKVRDKVANFVDRLAAIRMPPGKAS